MTTLIQTLISGLRLGSIYALMALGYTMVYGIAKMLNFAHGDIIMVGAYAVISTVSLAQLPGVVGVAVSVVVCVLQSLALLVFKSEPMAFPTIIDIPSVKLGEVVIDGMTILTLAVTAVIMVSLSLFINKTRLGKAMRAVSEDKDAAELMGISVNRTITMTFAIGSALAAVASIFYGATYTYIKPTTGSMPGIKAFTAAVFGGIGSIPGAMLGGILLGIIEQLSQRYISTLWTNAIVFGVLVLVLVVKPTGLLGKKISEKV